MRQAGFAPFATGRPRIEVPEPGHVAAIAGIALPHGASAIWLFNEATGTIGGDTSGNGKHATFAAGGAAPTWTARGISSDGGDYCAHPAITFADGAPHTYMVALKWTGDPPTGLLLPFGDTTSTQSTIYLSGTSTYVCTFEIRAASGAAAATMLPTATLFDGNWHTVAWAIDAARLLTLYIDNGLVGSYQLTVSSMKYNGIGRGYTSDSYNWAGEIAIDAVWPICLNQTEIVRANEYMAETCALRGIDINL